MATCSLVVARFPVSLAAQTQTKHQKNSQMDILHILHVEDSMCPSCPRCILTEMMDHVDPLLVEVENTSSTAFRLQLNSSMVLLTGSVAVVLMIC